MADHRYFVGRGGSGCRFRILRWGIGAVEAFSPIAIQTSACAFITSILIPPAAQTPGRRGELAAPGNSTISER
jgi:hypothetical protein